MTTNSSKSKHAESRRLQQALIEGCFNEFQETLPSEHAGWKELFRLCRDAGLVYCHCCGDGLVEYHHGRKVLCRRCNKTSSFTAGTFFEDIRNVTAWLCAIWFKEHGTPISINKFAELVGCAYSTAWAITRKLEAVVLNKMDEEHPEVDSSLFEKLFCKRSRETPARTHPRSEQECVDTFQTDELRSNEQDQHNDVAVDHQFLFANEFTEYFGEDEKIILGILSNDDPVSFDTIYKLSGIAPGSISSSLTLLELAGLTRSPRTDYYVRSTPIASATSKGNTRAAGRQLFDIQFQTDASSESCDPKMSDTVRDIINFVCVNFQRVSRKYIQYLAAAHWCNKNRTRWGSGMLMAACLRSPPILIQDILAFVSPPSIKISTET